MKLMKGGMSSTRLDAHGERATKAMLDSMVETVANNYVSIGAEHDPRIAPFGRVVAAEVVPLSDGEWELRGTFEIFEAGDDLAGDGREVLVAHVEADRVEIVADRPYLNGEWAAGLRDLSRVVGVRPRWSIKKAVEPVSVLTIGVVFVVSHLVAGFLEKVGEDVWDAFKARLGLLMKRAPGESQERLVEFRFTQRLETQVQTLEVILTDPSEADSETFLTTGLVAADRLAGLLFDANPDMVRVVAAWKDGTITILYGVRRDGAPLTIEPSQSDDGM